MGSWRYSPTRSASLSARKSRAGGAGIWLESSDRKESKGKWFGGGGMLYLVDDQDMWETYRVKVEGAPGDRKLKMASEKTGTLWSEVR